MDATPADIRAFANLPQEVPEAFLQKHLDAAKRHLTRKSGLQAAPDAAREEWKEAHIVKALSRALPWLNTFSLDGVAKVGRLEGSVEYRFLSPDEVEARVKELNALYSELLATIKAAAPASSTNAASSGSISFTAI